MSKPEVLRVVLNPSPHFAVKDWGVADAFDDFLSEEEGLEFSTEFVENDGAFVARRFFPLNAIREEEMRQIVSRFIGQL